MMKPGSPCQLPHGISTHVRGDANGQQKGQGVLRYTNECHFMKPTGDDGNPANAPDIIDVDSGANPAGGPTTFSAANEQTTTTTLPTREPIRGPYLPGAPGLIPSAFQSYGRPDMDTTSSTNDMSGASPDPSGQSSRPTPNSSAAASEVNRGQNLAPGGGGGQRSFETSPAVSHQSLSMPVGTTQTQQSSEVVDRFFGDPSSFAGIPSAAGLTATPGPGQPRFADNPGAHGAPPPHPPGSADFSVPHGWGEMPPGDGVLPSILNIGPMETMDLGWGPSS